MSSIVAAGMNTGRSSATSRMRGLTVAEKLMLVALGAVLIAAALGVSARRPNEVQTVTVRVEKGDTLWQLAQQHPIPGFTTEQTVEFIATANRLDGATVLAGTQLAVPQAEREINTAMR